MPKLTVRKIADVPQPSRVSRAVREKQLLYESYVTGIGSNDAGDLVLDKDETIRPVKVLLRRASTRLGIGIEIWDANGHVYFRLQEKRSRGRPRSRPQQAPQPLRPQQTRRSA